MRVWIKHASMGAACAATLALMSCSPDLPTTESEANIAEVITNRLDVPPEVVNNLGITFETALRSRLGVWRQVPGQLEVPESQQWVLRAPAQSRLTSVVPLWESVEAGAVLATLTVPELQATQKEIEFAERTVKRTKREVTAARARLSESESHLEETRSFEAASRERFQKLQGVAGDGNPLSARERIDAQRSVTEASKARLDATIDRDELVSRVELKEIEADQARLAVAEKLKALSVLTGLTTDELRQEGAQGPAWRHIQNVSLRAPASGVVVELRAAQGQVLEPGTPIVHLYDTSELRFRGHLPEGDLGSLSAGKAVRLEFPSKDIESLTTELAPLIPVADEETRMVHLEAVVPNENGRLAHGLSVMAHLLIQESKNDEVLIPRRCVVLDGLEAIVFKQDPDDPNVVVRTAVELGARSPSHVEVLAGVLDNDLLVADGIRQLRQTGLGKAPEGGHFHADGTWHAGEEDK